MYAKDKTKKQVEIKNNSPTNMLQSIIPNSKINFKLIGLNKFDYKMLMDNDEVDITSDKAIQIIELYNKLDLKKYFIINWDNDEKKKDKYSSISYLYKKIRENILSINHDKKYVIDVLVEYLYNHKKSNFKTTLWSSFGDVIVENIIKNIRKKLLQGYIQCSECNKLINPINNRQKYCPTCWKEINKEQIRQRVQKYRNVTL